MELARMTKAFDDGFGVGSLHGVPRWVYSEQGCRVSEGRIEAIDANITSLNVAVDGENVDSAFAEIDSGEVGSDEIGSTEVGAMKVSFREIKIGRAHV